MKNQNKAKTHMTNSPQIILNRSSIGAPVLK